MLLHMVQLFCSYHSGIILKPASSFLCIQKYLELHPAQGGTTGTVLNINVTNMGTAKLSTLYISAFIFKIYNMD
jgi:hypothetical protein